MKEGVTMSDTQERIIGDLREKIADRDKEVLTLREQVAAARKMISLREDCIEEKEETIGQLQVEVMEAAEVSRRYGKMIDHFLEEH